MKKFLSLILTISLIAAMILTAGLPVSAASNTMYEYKHFKAGAESDTKNYIYSNAALTGQNFYATKAILSYVEDGKIGEETISDTPMFKITNGTIVSWPKRNIDVSEKPVINFSFSVYIPKGQENKTRELQVQFAKKSETTDPYNNNTYGLLAYYISKASDGKIGYSGSLQANVSTQMAASGLPVGSGEWHKIEIRAFTNNNRLKYAMYVDGCIAMISAPTVTNISADDFGIAKMSIGGSSSGETYIKDIKLSAEDYDPFYEPEIPFSNVPFNDITVTTAGALNSDKYGAITEMLQSSGQTSEHYKSNSYENVNYTKENGTLKVELTPSETQTETHALIQNMRKPLTTYFEAGQTKYMQMSYDVMIPSGTESSARKQWWMLSNNSSYANSFTINSEIKNNEAKFYISNVADENMTGEKSFNCAVESDKWYRIIYVLAVTDNTDKYNIAVKGYAEDLSAEKTYQVYEANAAANKLETGNNFIGINQERTDIVTPKSAAGTKIVTYYDNIKMSIFNTDLSANFLGVESISDRFSEAKFVELGWNAAAKKANITVKKPSGENPTILAAAYQVDGSLIACEICTASVSADGTKLFADADFSKYSDIKTIKAFAVDSFENLIPLARSNKLTFAN